MALKKSFAASDETTSILSSRSRPLVLIAEHDGAVHQALKDSLLLHGLTVIHLSDKNEILRRFPDSNIKLVIIGSFGNTGWDGLELATHIRELANDLPIVFIAKDSSEDLAIAALRARLTEYIRQPYEPGDLVSSVARYLSDPVSESHKQQTRQPAATIVDGDRMIGKSLVIQEIRAAIGTIAATDSNVLVIGETGTGKELVAELIHKNSTRARQPLVCINCAAIPDNLLESELFGYERGAFTGAHTLSEGKLKSGDGGTIFLDEIGDMSPYAQAKILRVIESRELQRLGGKKNIAVDVRFIAATNKDLERAVSEKEFRKDLYYRLNVASIHLPQLKDRREDIPALCEHYIGHFNDRFQRRVEGFSEETLQSLLQYDWPGNVRELKNLLEATIGNFRCVQNRNSDASCGFCPEVSFRCRQISPFDLPEQFRRRLYKTKTIASDDRYPLLSVLNSTNWNISKAAQKLHWSRMTVYRKMAKYRIRRKHTLP